MNLADAMILATDAQYTNGSALVNDVVWELIKFVVYALVIILAVFVGSRIRIAVDKSKAAKEAAQSTDTVTDKTEQSVKTSQEE